MIQEAADMYALLKAVHASIDKMVEGLSDEEWLKKPLPNFNNVAAVIDHISRVERRFFAALVGETIDTKSGEPFQVDSWDLAAIRKDWDESLPYAEGILSQLTEENLSEPGLKLGIGEVNKRQLMSYTIAHTTHHRGQLPLIKKLLG